ncbi:AAA family ATPase [Luteibacter yeojuensis]|uniref:AAA domain-containing protein n=1 Tax=Luteibacter yeojuensis TaxID=345309 RepID=A0A0F3L160_9GAMM|nr:ATP-binding protein [Luteibacter yeojuensis]KJV36962.1 hypothetical protein VI08_01845 [Luteibacter yeojuensis]
MAAQGQAAPPATVEAWLDNRPSWLRAAAHGLVTTGRPPDDAALDALADHCHAEAAGTLAGSHPSLAAGVIQAVPLGPELRIQRLWHIRGVNAFGQRAELDLGGDLTVVYGPNGAGKSGYARLLKQMCGAKAAEPIHGNVFGPAGMAEPVSAMVRLRESGDHAGTPYVNVADHAWQGAQGTFGPLASVPVFDSATAAHLGQGASTATHLPRSMRFVNTLIKVSGYVAERLRQRGERLVSMLPPVPPLLAGTRAAGFHQSLSAATTLRAVNEGCQFTPEEAAERIGLEAALLQADPATAHGQVVGAINHLANLSGQMGAWALTFDDAAAQGLAAARAHAAGARQAAVDYGRDFFAGIPLPGVGGGTWLRLWAAAAAYAQTAYPDHVHPNTDEGSRCVLCQQPLADDGKRRMADFADYVANRLQADATTAERERDALIAAIPGPLAPDYWPGIGVTTGMTPEAADLLGKQVEQRLANLRAGDAVVTAVDWAPFQAAVAQTQAALIARRDALAQLLDPEGRKCQEARLLDLQGQEWLSTIQDAVLAEVERKRQLGIFEDAERLAQTNALTTFSNAIAKAELAGGFVDRFNHELARLGGTHIPVRLSHKQEGKGVVTFTIGLAETNAKVKSREVLSEGEQRVVALAAFLADVTGTHRSLPVIFDDPISSLDQRFEEAVALRLVELAESRQVIVFTHRLSMGVLIEHSATQAEAKGGRVVVDVVAIDRRGHEAGVPATIKVFAQSPKKGFNELDSKVRSAAKLDHDEQQNSLKAACSNFRILMERAVEDHLCAKVVVRYRREIKTGGMLTRLSAVTRADCELIEGMMTKYSAFEHSQSYETPSSDIDPNDLLADIATMVAWIKEFDGRTVS